MGEIEYIDYVEGLSDRAGCQCVGPVIECKDVDGLFYEPAIATEYDKRCSHTCLSLAMPGITNIKNATNPIDLGGGRAVNLPEYLQNAVTRLSPDGAVLGQGSCFDGEVAGWTFERLAGTACCSGCSFKALSAQEAFRIYSFRSVGEIITGLVAIGVCLPTSGVLQSG